MKTSRLLLAAALTALAPSSCARPTSHYAVDAVMTSAHRPDALAMSGAPNGLGSPKDHLPKTAQVSSARGPGETGRYQLLAGDLHCHVGPPDQPPHVTRGVTETVELARSEGLDFVVLTPHVAARFFVDEGERARVQASLSRLTREVAAEKGPKPIFITGFEYTDHSYGHVGVAFADLDEVLRAVPASEAARRPERFFEEVVARGGVLVVNHPLVTPLDSIISMARADLSWRPFTGSGPFPPEIVAVHKLAQGFEAYNLTATHLRDRYLLGDTEHSLRATLQTLDREILAQGRKMSPVGGSDSHSSHLRATTFVLSEGRSARSIRDALVAGRVCVRDPEACSLMARAPGGAWQSIGGSIKGASSIEVSVRGEDIEIYVGGQSRATLPTTGTTSVSVNPGACSVVRARAGVGYSAPIYVNCPFAG